MSIPHANSGEIVDLRSGPAAAAGKTATLVKTGDLELIRLVLPAGKQVASHQALGEITVHCLTGRVTFTSHGKRQELAAGQLLYLEAGAPHALAALEDSALLVTMLLPKVRTRSAPFDAVQEAGEESFPASDPPSYSGITRP